MKVGIQFFNEGIQNIDMRHPEDGNMGVGGTEYEVLLLARYLTLLYDEFEIILYLHDECELPDDIDYRIVKDDIDAATKAAKDNLDVYITRNGREGRLYETISELKLPTVIVGHNFYHLTDLDNISKCTYVKRNVYVSRQEYDIYIDHNVTKKSTWIYNMINAKGYPKRNNEFNPVVTYMGALIEGKRFHALAKIWKDIVKEVPNARLQVIGGGNLYSRRSNNDGSYGVTNKEYESKFMPYLLDESGNVLNSVEFLGVLGKEKTEVLRQSAVAAITSIYSETFCISAVEFEAMGIPVVAAKKYGLLDTVKDKKTGLMYNNDFQMKKQIIKLLKDKNLNINLGNNARVFVEQEFDAKKVTRQWYALLYDVMYGKNVIFYRPINFYFKHLKFLKIINLHLKKVPLLKNLPSIFEWHVFLSKLKRSLIKQ